MACAVANPWWFLVGCINRGSFAKAHLTSLLRQGLHETTGPLAAAWASLRRAKVTTSLNWEVWTDCVGRQWQDPLGRPRGATRAWLLQAFRQSQLAAACKRRPEFKPLNHGLDHWATCRWLRGSKAPESTKASLRAIMTGSLVTQSLACKWVEGGPLCPFCGIEAETPYHRFWVCLLYTSPSPRD